MNIPKKQTLEQIDAAINTVEAARADKSLTLTQKHQLESTHAQLVAIQNSIIQLQQQALVDTLTQDAQALQTLSVQIAQSAAKLSKVAAVLGKVTKAIQTLINAITTGITAGLL
jgi:hypothetical protein